MLVFGLIVYGGLGLLMSSMSRVGMAATERRRNRAGQVVGSALTVVVMVAAGIFWGLFVACAFAVVWGVGRFRLHHA